MNTKAYWNIDPIDSIVAIRKKHCEALRSLKEPNVREMQYRLTAAIITEDVSIPEIQGFEQHITTKAEITTIEGFGINVYALLARQRPKAVRAIKARLSVHDTSGINGQRLGDGRQSPIRPESCV